MSYQCNYCGFTGEYMHDCKTYLESIKLYVEAHGGLVPRSPSTKILLNSYRGKGDYSGNK